MESIKKTLDKRWFHLRTTELKLISSYGNISGLLSRNARAKIGVMTWGKHRNQRDLWGTELYGIFYIGLSILTPFLKEDFGNTCGLFAISGGLLLINNTVARRKCPFFRNKTHVSTTPAALYTTYSLVITLMDSTNCHCCSDVQY